MAGKTRGIISLLALFIMATVTATAVGASIIILDELQQTESYDQAVAAAYAAEAGLEQGLFLVKDYREQNDTLVNLQAALAASSTGSTVLDWTRESTVEDQFFVEQLSSEQTEHVDFVEPATFADCPEEGSCIESLEITYSDRCTNYGSEEHGFSHLEITMLPLTTVGLSTFDVSKEVHACNYDEETGYCDRIVLNAVDATDINDANYYRFSFTTQSPAGDPPVFGQTCVIENLTVNAYSKPGAVGDRIPISTRVIIKSTGSFGRSQQALTAQVPMRAPASGLFNYVIFSESDLEVVK